MRNFGNFLVSQNVALRKVLVENFKSENKNSAGSEEFIVRLVNYQIELNKMNHDELCKHAKVMGVKIPCPANY